MKTVSIAWVAVALFVLPGCAGDLQNFVGTWSVSGTTMYSGVGESPIVEQINENMTIIEGSDSDIVFAMKECNVPASVNGETATIRGSYSCVMSYRGNRLTVTFTNGVAMVRDGAISFDATGTFTFLNNGQTYPGNITFNQTAVRLGK